VSYTAEARTFGFILPAVSGELTTAPLPRTLEVLDQSLEARNVVITASIFVGDVYRRFAAALAAAGGTAFPYAIVSFDEATVGGQFNQNIVAPPKGAGVGQGANFAHIVSPDIPHYFTVPPGKKLFANARGSADIGAVTLRLSVTSTSLIEPTTDGQSKKIVEGIRRAMVDVIPDAIVAAKRLLGR
jgi:hypothetical protein